MIQNNRVAVAQSIYNEYKDEINIGTNSNISENGIKAISEIESKFSQSAVKATAADVTDSGVKNISCSDDSYSGSYSGGGGSFGGSSGGSSSSSGGGGTISNITTGTAIGEILNVDGNIATNNGVIDTSKPIGTGTKYEISDEDLKYLAFIAYREQGSVEGAKLEISLILNLYESSTYKGKYPDVVSFVKNSGWFATAKQSYSYPGDAYYQVAESIVRNGDRYLPSNVVEHDCLSDITSISTGSVNDRNSYIPGKTVIKNRYGSTYVFVGFAPNGGDPFGYLA
jgi:hypothetical protein